MKIKADLFWKSAKGYKMSAGHFELGSNLHINDYYYAKRLFYNSFYTNRFAFLICKLILKEFDHLIKHVLSPEFEGEAPITLLGYEHYSELLVGSVRKMLNDYLNEIYPNRKEIFNHDIFTKESLFLKNPEKIGTHIISIFPISTTFSSSVKSQNEIEEILRENGFRNIRGKITFHNPVINCLVISNDSLKISKDFYSSDIEGQFGWRAFDLEKKEITVENIDHQIKEKVKSGSSGPRELFDKSIRQKFFIPLYSQWQLIYECKACYPNNPEHELCLIETKSNSITPNLIFGYPKSITYSNAVNIFEFFDLRDINGRREPVVYRKHFKRDNNHYIYYIRLGRFLLDNKAAVKKWLVSLRNETLANLKDKNIVIVTPTLGSNSGFVNFLNDILFSDTATVIQYNPKEEFVQNFRIFYTDLLNNADFVIFADDVIASTQTITEINFFVKNARKGGAGVDYSLTLINRTGYYNYLKLEEKFSQQSNGINEPRILSFLNIHVEPIMHRLKFPYVSLMEKFNDLAEYSVLDSMKIHFKEKERAVRPIDLITEHDRFDKEGNPKALFQFLMLHEFMQLFNIDRSTGKYKHEQLIEETFENGGDLSYKNVVRQLGASHSAVGSFAEKYPEYKYEIKNGLYKICSSEPYLKYKNIRAAVFNWILNDLKNEVDKINEQGNANGKVDRAFFRCQIAGEPTIYSPYQNFRFLLNRGAKLKMNFVYSIQTLRAINFIIQGIDEYGIIEYFELDKQTPVSSVKESRQGNLFDKDKLPEDKQVIAKAAILTKSESKSKKIFPVGFITFYVGLLQELIIEHESKALGVVINVKRIIDKSRSGGYDFPHTTNKTLRNTYNNHFIYLLRLLVLENTFIFHRSSDHYLKKISADIDVSFKTIDYETFFKRLEKFKDTYSFLYTRYMLSRFDFKDGRPSMPQKPEKEIYDSFSRMMLLKALLIKDNKELPNNNIISIEAKINKILMICCQIMGIKDGGGFLAVKYKNKGNDDSDEGDIAVVGDYTTAEDTSFKNTAFPLESVLYKVFDGIIETNSKKQQTVFEITLGDDYNYHFRNNDQISVGDLSDLYEFKSVLFRNLIFIRLSEINYAPSNQRADLNETESDGEQPGHSVYSSFANAVICLYQGKVDDKNKDRVFDCLEAAKKGRLEEEYQKADYNRFNPKKVRLLLLLRNNLTQFVNHHLNNDSLRAYIEALNQNRLHLTLKHGTDQYESLVKEYVGQLKIVAKKESHSEILEIAGYLDIAFRFLINKLQLLSIANSLFDKSTPGSKNGRKLHNVRELVEEFNNSYRYILMFSHSSLNKIDSLDYVKFDNAISQDEYLNVAFELFPGVLREMVFEIIYNIRKHIVHDAYDEIDEDNKLHMKLDLIEQSGYYWFVVTNNFSKKSREAEKQINSSISERKIDGLNLIYHILFGISDKEVRVEILGEKFIVYLPLKPHNS